jgi:hypothetical protein
MGVSLFVITIIPYVICIAFATIVSIFSLIKKNKFVGVIFGIVLYFLPPVALLYIPYRSFNNKNIYRIDKNIGNSTHIYDPKLFNSVLHTIFKAISIPTIIFFVASFLLLTFVKSPAISGSFINLDFYVLLRSFSLVGLQIILSLYCFYKCYDNVSKSLNNRSIKQKYIRRNSVIIAIASVLFNLIADLLWTGIVKDFFA